MSGNEPPEDPKRSADRLLRLQRRGSQGSPQRSTWYRNPIVLVALGLFVAILLGLAFYLLADQTTRHRRHVANPDIADDVNGGADELHRRLYDHRAGRSAGIDHDDRPTHHRGADHHGTPPARLRPPASRTKVAITTITTTSGTPLAVSSQPTPVRTTHSRGVDETERFSVGKSPSPWYLKRWVLALWGLAVVVLIAVIIYGLAILARGNGGSAPAPTTTRTSTPTSSQRRDTVHDAVDH